jgi:hypothetical protein
MHRMPHTARRPLFLAAFAVAAACGPLRTAVPGEVGTWLRRTVAAPLRTAHRQPPPPGADPCVADLAARITWLEHHLDASGSIVAKQPDVWGQSRLTQHRLQYEQQMARQLGLFTERTSAAIRRSDQAFLGLALAMQSASGRRRTAAEVAVPELTTSNNVVTSIQGLLPTTNEAAGRNDPVVIARTGPFAAVPNPAALPYDGEPLALEPTVHLDQLSRYLNHLNQLRRINEGDDSADAPGYALNLVRIPVSILPGKRTQQGHGAEITITADPLLGADLLPVTFRSLVINDLVDMIAPALTWCVNDPQCVAWAATITNAAPAPAAPAEARRGFLAAVEGLRTRLPTITPAPAPSVKTRRSRLPIPFTQLADVAGIEQIAILIRDTRTALANHPANVPCIGYMGVRGHLAEELAAAWDFLAINARRHVWDELPAWNLAPLVRGRQVRELAAARRRFFADVGMGGDGGPELIPALPAVDTAGVCCEAEQHVAPLCRTTTAVLAWGILVESALLDERLAEDVRESATARGRPAPLAVRPPPFYGPCPSAEARAAFADYVRCRWPIRVFALDPVSEEQNVDDAYARRRELQIAMATAAASGRLNAQAMARFTRRLEEDMAVIALNKTAVGFSHGSDTFGWRFYPRVQTPPTRTGLAALGETICGPTTAADIARRRLEPGQRECTALIVMPAFVPWVTLDVRTRWFALAHTGGTEPGIKETLAMERAVHALRAGAAACGRGGCHDAALAHLLRAADQLERRLPLQTLQAHVPQENTAGGFELFNAGVTDLAPELLGWYGAPGVDPAANTTLFLVGKGFSVLDTKVIAGGRPARFHVVSRDLMEVEVPAGAMPIVPAACPTEVAATRRRSGVLQTSAAEPLPPPGAAGDACAACGPTDGCGPDCNRREVVDIHLATPYGVSGHLLVPVVRRGPAAGGMPAFAPACTLGLSFGVTKSAATPAAKVDEFFTASCDAITITVPESFIPPAKAVLRLLVRDAATGATAAAFSFPDPFFDARRGRYVIAGGDLRNFVGDTSRPATDKTLRGAVKPYLDSLLQQGGLGEDGDAVALTASAAIVSGEHEVPVGGALAVTATRRGKTTAEPEPAVTQP